MDSPLGAVAYPTVITAIKALASVCDGAVTKDAKGFNKMDRHKYYKVIIDKALAKGWLSPKEEKKAFEKLLVKYKKQLADLGIDYDDIGAIPRAEKEHKNQESGALGDKAYTMIIKLPDEPSPKDLALWHFESMLISHPQNQMIYDASNPGAPYLWLHMGDHHELVEIDGSRFAQDLAGMVLRDSDNNPESHSLVSQTIKGLMPSIKFLGEHITKFKRLPLVVDMAPRVREVDGAIWYDLGTPEWMGIKTMPGNVSIEPLPVGFIRRNSMKAQVMPDLTASPKDALKLTNYFNMADDYRLLCAVYTVNCHLPSIKGVPIPKPILSLDGGPGSGKSSAAMDITDLTDPDADPLKKAPTKPKDLALLLREHYVTIIDNVSELEQWFQDMLCQACTGGSDTSRTLYTNLDTTTARFNARVILTEIAPPWMETDLKDRTLPCHMLPMSNEDKRSPSELAIEFKEQKPQILGGILKTASEVLKTLPDIMKESKTWKNKPRMLDFACIGEACARIWGYNAGYFLDIYNRILLAESTDILGGINILRTFQTFVDMQPRKSWDGLASDLFDCLAMTYRGSNTYAQLPDKWPKSGVGLGKLLSKYSQDLLKMGYKIERKHGEKGTVIKVSYTAPPQESVCDADSSPEDAAPKKEEPPETKLTDGKICQASVRPSVSLENDSINPYPDRMTDEMRKYAISGKNVELGGEDRRLPTDKKDTKPLKSVNLSGYDRLALISNLTDQNPSVRSKPIDIDSGLTDCLRDLSGSAQQLNGSIVEQLKQKEERAKERDEHFKTPSKLDGDKKLEEPEKACLACGADIGPGHGNYYDKYCASCGPKLPMVSAAAKAHPEGFSTSELWEDLAMRGRAPRKEHLPGMLQHLGYIEAGTIWTRSQDLGSLERVRVRA
jgi:hypothetical protein